MCSTGCPTRDHANWGECVRAKSMKVAYCGVGGGDATAQKRWDANLQEYRDARAAGIQPKSTKIKDVRDAVTISEKIGRPLDTSRL